MTPTYTAKTLGSRVMGVDITPGMIDRSNERTIREGVQDVVEFRLADARELPFEDNLFDVVIAESVVAFLADKVKVLSELVRVAKPGGCVGLNESTWVKEPPHKMLAYFSRVLGSNLKPLTADGWKELLEDAGLQDVTASAHAVTYRDESINRLRRMGWGELGRALYRSVKVGLTKPEYRRFMRDALSDPRGIIDYVGYGIYVGCK